MHGIAAITGNMHRSLRYFVILERITNIISMSSFFFLMILKYRKMKYEKKKEKDNKYTKSSGYTVQGGGYGGETVEPQRCIAPP